MRAWAPCVRAPCVTVRTHIKWPFCAVRWPCVAVRTRTVELTENRGDRASFPIRRDGRDTRCRMAYRRRKKVSEKSGTCRASVESWGRHPSSLTIMAIPVCRKVL